MNARNQAESTERSKSPPRLVEFCSVRRVRSPHAGRVFARAITQPSATILDNQLTSYQSVTHMCLHFGALCIVLHTCSHKNGCSNSFWPLGESHLVSCYVTGKSIIYFPASQHWTSSLRGKTELKKFVGSIWKYKSDILKTIYFISTEIKQAHLE